MNHTGSILYLVIVVRRLLSTDLQTTLANLLMTPYERNSIQSNRVVKFVKMGGQASKWNIVEEPDQKQDSLYSCSN